MKFKIWYIIAYTEWLTDFSLQICITIIIKKILLHLMRVNINNFYINIFMWSPAFGFGKIDFI